MRYLLVLIVASLLYSDASAQCSAAVGRHHRCGFIKRIMGKCVAPHAFPMLYEVRPGVVIPK